jgi:hypothetical protein
MAAVKLTPEQRAEFIAFRVLHQMGTYKALSARYGVDRATLWREWCAYQDARWPVQQNAADALVVKWRNGLASLLTQFVSQLGTRSEK